MYLGPKEMRMGSVEGLTMRIFVACTIHLTRVRIIKSKRLRKGGSQNGKRLVYFQNLTGNPIGEKRLLGRLRSRWEDNIAIYFK